jgi:hypothetical protein
MGEADMTRGMTFLATVLVAALAAACSKQGQTTHDPNAGPATKPAAAVDANDPNTWPRTLDQAVANVVAGMSDRDKTLVRALSQRDMISFHMGWGMGIRNEFGLWRGNLDLLKSCAANEARITGRKVPQPPGEDANSMLIHPDDASGVILEAVWLELQKSAPAPTPEAALTFRWHGPDMSHPAGRYAVGGKDFETDEAAIAEVKTQPELATRPVQVIVEADTKFYDYFDLLKAVIDAGCRNVRLVRGEDKPAAGPATQTASAAPTTRPVQYLGLGEGEEERRTIGGVGETVRASRVQDLSWTEYADLADQSCKHELHGRWLYLAVEYDRDVPYTDQQPGCWFTETERYRVDLGSGSLPAGVPARSDGKLTDGAPMMELLAGIAVRVPEKWFVDEVSRPDANAPGLHVRLRKWPATGKDYMESRFEQVEFDLAETDANRPIEEIVARINAIKPKFTKPPATEPATAPAPAPADANQPFKMLEKPSPFRQVIVGRLKTETVHMSDNGPGQGSYNKGMINGPAQGSHHKGTITDRRTGRKQGLMMFAAFTPFFTSFPRPVNGKYLWVSYDYDVLAAARFQGDNERAYYMIVPLSVMPAEAATKTTAKAEPRETQAAQK